MKRKARLNGLKIEVNQENSIMSRFLIYLHIKREFYGGKGNIVVVGKNVTLSKVVVHVIGNNNKIVIDDNCELHNCVLRMDGNKNLIKVGNGTYIGGAYLHALDSTSIEIGKGCLLSTEIDMRSGEHPIYNLKDRRQYNYAKDIKIGNHVWIGKRVQCLKGVEIADNSVIGAGSLVTKRFSETNIIVAGNPAKIIKTSINWRR